MATKENKNMEVIDLISPKKLVIKTQKNKRQKLCFEYFIQSRVQPLRTSNNFNLKSNNKNDSKKRIKDDFSKNFEISKKHHVTNSLENEMYNYMNSTLEFLEKYNRKMKNTESPLKNKSFRCDKCDKVFHFRHSLNRHLNSEHREILNYPCEKCERKFHDKQDLDEHVKLAHKISADFDCDVCGKKFSSKISVKRHKVSLHTV